LINARRGVDHRRSGRSLATLGRVEEGQRIWVLDPDEGWVAAVYLGVGDPEEIEDARVVGGKRKRDRAWVQYEEGEREGTTGLHPFTGSEMREDPPDPDD
jgi:hypothetical protein